MYKANHHPLTTALGVGIAASFMLAACGGNRGATHNAEPAATATLVPQDKFTVGPITIDTATVGGVETEGTSLSEANIKKTIALVQTFALRNPHIKLVLGDPNSSSDRLPIGIDVTMDRGGSHAFVITKTQEELDAMMGDQSQSVGSVSEEPGATKIDTTTDSRLTAITFLNSASALRFGLPNMNGDEYNITVESCNNVLNLGLDKPTVALLGQAFGAQKAPSVDLVIRKVDGESICNSIALARTARDAGVSYANYFATASQQQVQAASSLGLPVPYVAFSASDYASLRNAPTYGP